MQQFLGITQLVDTALQVVVAKKSVAMQLRFHLVKEGKPFHHQEALCTEVGKLPLLESRWPGSSGIWRAS
jgi:hypothetical protein